MLELFFFMLGIVNSIMLILIFLIRKKRLAIIQRFAGFTCSWLFLPSAGFSWSVMNRSLFNTAFSSGYS